ISVLLLCGRSSAADVKVSYLVEAATIKDIPTGTPLTFDLYQDAACATLIDSIVVAIDDVTILGLKSFKVSGGVKPPKIVELRAILGGVTAVGHLYLTVRAAGPTPLAGSVR